MATNGPGHNPSTTSRIVGSVTAGQRRVPTLVAVTPAPTDGAPARPSGVVRGAAAVAALESGGFVALAVAELSVLVAERVSVAVTTTAFFGVCGVALGWCARGLHRLEPWARGPLVVAQLLLLAIAWTYSRPYAAAAAAVAVLAVVGLVLLLHPATTHALSDEPAP